MLRICLHVGGWATAATGKVLELLLITGEAHICLLTTNKTQLHVPFCRTTWKQAANIGVMHALQGLGVQGPGKSWDCFVQGRDDEWKHGAGNLFVTGIM